MPTRNTRARRPRWASIALVSIAVALVTVSVGCTLNSGQLDLSRTVTLFGDRRPASDTSDPDERSVELGVRFRSSTPGWITSIRFFKTAGNDGTHTGTLWSDTGAKLAAGTFRGESDHGWQELVLSSPVRIDDDTNYVASYHAPEGRYAADRFGLASATTNGPLTAPAHGASGHNSVYSYGDQSTFPTQNWMAANYWVDVRFVADGDVPVTSTTRPATTPTAGPSPTTATTLAPATTLPGGGGKPVGSVQPAGGLQLRDIDGGANYFGRWSNSLPTDPGFYPISVFNETMNDPLGDAAKYKAIGVNGYVGLWNGMNPQIAAALKANGQFAFTAPGPNGAPGYGREWAGYEWFDEADGRNVCGDVANWLAAKCSGSDRTSAASIKAMADAIRAVDGTRPTYGQYTKPVALGQGLDTAARKAYIDAVDVVSYDFYPISDPWESPARNLWEQYDAVTQVRTIAGRSKPVWVFIETSKLFDNPKGRVTPTPEQIQAQVWHAVIGGARGIEYFNHNMSGEPTYSQHLLIDPTYAHVTRAVSVTNAQIHALAPVLNAPFVDNVLTVGSGQVNSMVKYHNGAAYLFVASRSKASQQVTLKVNGFGNGTAEVLHENRTVAVNNGTITDTFSGETAVHIYKIG